MELVDGQCPDCKDEPGDACDYCGGDAVRVDLDRRAWKIEPYRSIPGGPSKRIARDAFLEVVPAADVVGYLGARAQAIKILYSLCHVEMIAGVSGSLELGVSLQEREALYRLIGIEESDEYSRDLITIGFAAIQRGRAEGKGAADKERHDKEEAERKTRGQDAKRGR